jgi:hypothetical protein
MHGLLLHIEHNGFIVQIGVRHLLDQADETFVDEGRRRVLNNRVNRIVKFVIMGLQIDSFGP